MFKILITFIIFGLTIPFVFADGSRYENIGKGNIQEQKTIKEAIQIKEGNKNIVEDTKNSFEKRKEEVIKDYKEGRVSLIEAKTKLLKEKESFIEAGKKKLEQEEQRIKAEKMNLLKNQVREKIDLKLQIFSNLEKESKNKLYTKVLSKIDEGLTNNKISDKQRLLYNILRDIFNDIINE